MGYRRREAFTLIELLVVIGIVGILLAITLIAINPSRQFALANNAKRSADVNTIINAVSQVLVDTRGIIPPMIPTGTPAPISSSGVPGLCATIVPRYVAALPNDPQQTTGGYAGDCSSYDTGYTIVRDGTRVTVSAPLAELGEVISVSR
jgi:prepilin-type N-terminal cleavage/methylation domain-containing protein